MPPSGTGSDVKAVILAGGLGTRLRPFTFAIPKPLIPLGERTLIEILVQHLRENGIEEIILSTGYLSELVRAYCRDGSQWGVRIEYCAEDKPLGTAGPLALLREALSQEERFLLLNGDLVTDLDLRKLIAFHESRRFVVTVAYAELVTTSAFGVLEIEDGVLTNILEKPSTTQRISGGIYVIEQSALDLVPDETFFTVPELIDRVRSRGDTVGAFRIDGFWKGLERTDQFADVMEFLDGKASGSGGGEGER